MHRWSNTDAPGVWLYRVGNIGPNENVEPPEFPGSVRPGTWYLIDLLCSFSKRQNIYTCILYEQL